MIVPILFVGALSSTIGLHDAVDVARAGRSGSDDAEALLIEADRLKDSGIAIDNLRLSLEHRSFDQFWSPRLDDLGVPYEPFDNLSVALQVPLPTLEQLVARSAVDHTARAEQALLADDRLRAARDVARDASALVALRQEQQLVEQQRIVADRLVTLQRERVAAQRVTAADLDDAERERLRATADAVDIDDDLDRARRKVLAAIGRDDVDDDLDAVCLRPLPALDALVDDATASNPRHHAAAEARAAVEREDLAWKLGYVPWPSAVQGTYINRNRFAVDDYRLRVDVELPLFRFLDTTGASIDARARAAAAETRVVDSSVRLDVAALREAAAHRQNLVTTMTVPPTPPTPIDPAEALEAELGALDARRRRLRAVARCAAVVVELEAVRGRR